MIALAAALFASSRAVACVCICVHTWDMHMIDSVQGSF